MIFADRACERRRHELDDSGPHDGGGANSPGKFLIVRLQIHGQHDRQRVGDNSRHIVDVHVGRDVGAAFALRESHGKRRQTHGADEESQGKAGQQVAHAESHGDADRHEQKCGDDHLRHVEANLRNGGVNVSPLERPPAKRSGPVRFPPFGFSPSGRFPPRHNFKSKFRFLKHSHFWLSAFVDCG